MDAVICLRCQGGTVDYETLWKHYSAQDEAGKSKCILCGRWSHIAEAYDRQLKKCTDKTRTACSGCTRCRL